MRRMGLLVTLGSVSVLLGCSGESSRSTPADAGSPSSAGGGAGSGVEAGAGAPSGSGGASATGGSPAAGAPSSGAAGGESGAGGNGEGTGGLSEGSGGFVEGSGGVATGTGGSVVDGLPIDPRVRGGFCANGWCWSHPLPQGNNIRSMWSAEGAGVWAAGDAGTVLRYDGQNWDRISVNGGSAFVWGSGPTDIYLVPGDVWHYDGTRLSQVVVSLGDFWIYDLSGTGPNDVWAAAYQGAAHFDGAAWTRVQEVPINTRLDRVAAAGESSVWFAGAAVYRWDGQAFAAVNEHAPVALISTGPDDLWYTADQALFRGGTAGFEQVPTIRTSMWADRCVFASGPEDVYALDGTGSLRHFDGGVWNEGSYAFTDSTIYGGHADTGTAHQPGEAWLGGGLGRLWRVTEGALEALTPEIPPVRTRDLKGVWSDGSNVYAVGGSFLRLDASGETDQWEPVAGTEDLFGFMGIWGSSPTDIWVVGTFDRIWHFDGTTLTSVTSGLPEGASVDWNAVYGSGPSDVWAVGTQGEATHYDGQVWTAAPTASVSNIDDVWVSPDGNAYAVGENGIAMHFTPGQGWLDIADITYSTVQWKSVTGTGNDDLWVAGHQGNEIVHFDGTEWTSMDGTGYASGSIEKLWALGPDDVWGASSIGGVAHWDGSRWTRLDVKAYASLHGLWMAPDGEGWAVGNGGTILHRMP